MKRYHALAVLALVIGAGVFNVDAAPIDGKEILQASAETKDAQDGVVKNFRMHGVAAGVNPGYEKKSAYQFMGMIEQMNMRGLLEGHECSELQAALTNGLAQTFRPDEKTESNLAILNSLLRYQNADCKLREIVK